MPFVSEITQIDSMAAVNAVGETLRRIDGRLVEHGERVAFIACELNECGNLGLDMKTLLLLSVFHDIGAYKTDEIDRMVEFETHEVWSHSIYGYLFLKYMSPLKEAADGILYHHTPWHRLENGIHMQYAALIHLADRIDIAYSYGKNSEVYEQLCKNESEIFCPKYVEVLNKYSEELRLYERLADHSYKDINKKRLEDFNISPKEAVEYLKMIVYSIDFRSDHTVTHTINTVSIALNIAQHFGMTKVEQEKIYLGALLHDVGKISIPMDILEYPGKLSDEKMTVMRTHVTQTEEMIRGIVPEEIFYIAVRHHEKLDGSGYPRGLTGEILTFSQRVVAVADIVSALSSRRSYKEPFPKEKTIDILKSMKQKQLDNEICEYIIGEYEEIMKKTDVKRAEIIDRYTRLKNEYEVLKERSESF